MFLVRLCLFVCVNLFLYAKCSIPVEKLCATPECEEPISKAKGAVEYNPASDEVLGFKKGQEIIITSKSKNAKDYWGAIVNGKRGYVPSNLLQETKVFYRVEDLIAVKVEAAKQHVGRGNPPQKNNVSDQIPVKKDEVEKSSLQHPAESVLGIPDNSKAPDSIQNPIKPDKPFKIIEGTTIYVEETDEITPSSTVDMQSAGQTVDPMNSNINNKDDTQERATIPPEVINLNSNYEGQSIQNGTNFTIVNVEENDENAIIESGDTDNEEEEEEDDEEGAGDDEEDSEQDDDLINEVLEDQIAENELGQAKKSSISGDDKSEEMIPASTHSGFGNVEKNTEQTVVNVIENSVTSEVNARVDSSRIMGQPPAEPLTQHFTQNVGVNKAENSVTGEVNARVDSSRIMGQPPAKPLTQHFTQNVGVKADIPDQERPSNVSMLHNPPSQAAVAAAAAAGSFQTKYGASQPIMSETPEPVTPPESQSMPPITQSVPPESQSMPPTTQSVPPESQSMPPTTHSVPPESQSMPPQSQSVPPEYYVKSEASPITQQPMAPGTTNGDTSSEQLATEVPVATPQNTTDTPNEILHSVTHHVIEEVPAEKLQTPQPASTEGSTIFSQFSVSADTLQEEPSNNVVDKPSLTPEIIQKVEVTTEAFRDTAQPVATEAASNQFPESSQTWKYLNQPDKVTPETVEAETEASPTPSVLTQVTKEDDTGAEDTKAPDQGSEEGSASVENVPEEPGTLSQITGIFSSWFTSAPDKAESHAEGEVNHEAAFPDTQSEGKLSRIPNGAPAEKCANGEFGSSCKDFASEEQAAFQSGWMPSGLDMESIAMPSNTFVYLVVTAITVLLFTLGHNFIEKRGKTGPLIAKINKLEHELLVSSKECLMLKDDIQSFREKVALYENSANDELVLSLQAELQESKKVRSELESSIEILQQELDAATEAGLDLNKMLSEVLTQKGGSESLLKSVENLQAQLDSQQRIIDEMTKKLSVKSQENEALQTALEAANDKSENLEEQLTDIKHNLNLHLKEKEDLTKDLNSQINQLKTRISQLGESKEKDTSRLKKELEETQRKLSESASSLTVREEELKALKESVKHLKGGKGDVKLETVFDVSRVKGELAKEVKENQTLMEKLQKEESSKKALAEQVKTLDGEMQKLKKGYEEAQQKKDEAENKLEVLSTYFKEKETQLQKELGLQEALWAQKKGDEKAVYNMMKSLQEEVESYKSQNETLKKEILDQERGLKNQIATLEQKAHENWVAARQAERKLEESKQEMAQLRNRLTLIEKNNSNVEGKGNLRSSEELNGVEAASPILHDTSSPLLFPPLPLDPNSSSLLPPGFMPPPMFMPPPIGGFIPPPPFLPGDRRPPPLGRMSSPPLNNRFSPSSPADYPFERMSSPPLSPPGSNYRSPNEDREHYRHRTPPYPPPLHPRNWDDSNEMPGFIPISSQRDPRRDHKGSNVSSEHSSSESLDKSSRHSGRV